NYAAWFDLGFLYNALGQSEDSISAYRKSVAAKPDVFESNLNLGLMLARAGQPGAEQFLRAATKLKPTAHEAEGRARAWLHLACGGIASLMLKAFYGSWWLCIRMTPARTCSMAGCWRRMARTTAQSWNCKAR